MKMYEYPENYEEAKIIINKAINDDYTQRKKRVALFVPVFLGTVATAIAAGLSIYSGEPTIAFLGPDLMMLMSPSILPYLKIRNGINKIKSGEYFELLSEKEVLEKAQEYVEEYNAYERKKMGNTEVAKDEDSEGFTL